MQFYVKIFLLSAFACSWGTFLALFVVQYSADNKQPKEYTPTTGEGRKKNFFM
jgi:hypothetical protein